MIFSQSLIIDRNKWTYRLWMGLMKRSMMNRRRKILILAYLSELISRIAITLSIHFLIHPINSCIFSSKQTDFGLYDRCLMMDDILICLVQLQSMAARQIQADLGQWIGNMGVADKFNNADIESGRTVHFLLRAMSRDIKIQLQEGSSAITRVTNWNALTEVLKEMGVRVSQEEKSKIINGSHEIVFKIISRLKEIHQKASKETQINIKDIDIKKEVGNADSLLELFLLAIVKHFSLSSKEALSLLSNDSKYLAHLLAKGIKGDFRPIQAFIAELGKNLGKIIIFSKNKENEAFFVRSIKPALISKSQSVGEISLQLIKTYLQASQNGSKISLLKQHLIGTLVLMIRRHPQMIDKILKTTLELVSFQADIIDEIIELTPKNQHNNLLAALWTIYLEQKKQSIFVSSSSFQKLISSASTLLKDPQMVLSSLSFFALLANDSFSLFNSTASESVISSIRSLQSTKQIDNVVFIHLCCSFIKSAGGEKHPLAPLIFKLLTSKLNSSSSNQYEIIANNLTEIIGEIPSIPALPILQALSQRSDLRISQLQLKLFIQVLSIGAEPKSAVAIYNMSSKSFVENVGLGFQLTNLLVQLINNFKDEEIIIDMTVKLVKVCLALYFANIKKLAERRKPISLKVKLQGQQATSKLKTLQIEVFLRKIVLMGISDINSSIQPLLCFSYIQIAALNKDQNRNFQKNLQSIISLLGDVGQLIHKYELQLVDSDPTLKQSKLKGHSPSPQRNNDDLGDNYSSFLKNSKRVKSSHPMSLSLAGVKNDAYMGIQKYVKFHQAKVAIEQTKRYKETKKQQDRKILTKIYEKKMIIEMGLKVKNVPQQQLQYLFDFDSKQDYARRQNINLPFYIKQAEQDRDTNGLQNMLRRYEKALRVYFTNYCGKKKGNNSLQSFDQYSQLHSFIFPSAVFKMLTDHGLENYITPKEIQTLARKVNYKMSRIRDDPEAMDFEAFKEVIVQIAFTMHTRPPKDLRGHPAGEMLEQFFSNLQLYAAENRISPQLFAAPQASNYSNQTEAIKVLNQNLLQNPDYILPQGYKKITQTKIIFDYKIYLQAMSQTYKQVYEVVDELLFGMFKFHIIQPFTKEEKIVTARPNIYFLQRQKLVDSISVKHIPVNLKKQVAKFPIKDRITAKQAATALADIIQAIELNHEDIGMKHQNPITKTKKEQEDQQRRKREIEDRKRSNFDRQIKTTMGENAARREAENQRKEKEREEELEKKRLQKERKERREKELKAKVQEFSQRKKQDEQSKKASEKSRIEKQREEFEKKKRENEEMKRKIEQIRKKKQQQQKQRKQKQKEQQKRKKQQQRRNYQKSKLQKKQQIQQYKSRKKGVSKVMDQPPAQQPSKE